MAEVVPNKHEAEDDVREESKQTRTTTMTEDKRLATGTDTEGVGEDSEGERESSESSRDADEDLEEFLLSMVGKLNMKDEAVPSTPVLVSFDLEGIAHCIKHRGCKNVIVMAGAGISVSAGIPDFRTKGSGLYSKLQQ